MNINRLERMIRLAMHAPDRCVLNMIYISESTVSIRVVSPIQWQDDDNRRFMAF